MADEKEQRAGDASGFHKVVLIVLAVLLVGSVGARVALGIGDGDSEGPVAEEAAGGGATGVRPDSLVPQTGQSPSGGVGGAAGTGAPAEERSTIEQALPYVTEGSLFALIGFAVGYASRKVFKLALILIALMFVAIQALSYGGYVAVDWGGAVEALNDLVLNLKENETLSQFLLDRIPTTGAFITGCLLGFKRG